MSDQLNTSPEMCIYWHDQTIKANHKVAELEARVAELEAERDEVLRLLGYSPTPQEGV